MDNPTKYMPGYGQFYELNPSTFEQNEVKEDDAQYFFVKVEGHDPIFVTVNQPEDKTSNQDVHSILEKWVTERYNFKPYDYWEFNECEYHEI